MSWIVEEKYQTGPVTAECGKKHCIETMGERFLEITSKGVFNGFVSKRKEAIQVWVNGELFEFKVTSPEKHLRESLKQNIGGDSEVLTAKMPGKVLRVAVNVGDSVDTGKTLIVLEAMKMENHLHVNHPVEVGQIHIQAGQVVETGQLLISFKK